MYEYNIIIKRVIDADTIVADIDMGYDFWKKNQRIRLSRIDAPEMSTQEGVAAKEFVNQFCGCTARMISLKDKTDSFGRYLGEIYLGMEVADEIVETNLSDFLLNNGMAVLYRK